MFPFESNAYGLGMVLLAQGKGHCALVIPTLIFHLPLRQSSGMILVWWSCRLQASLNLRSTKYENIKSVLLDNTM